MTLRILFVDDEPNVLQGLQRMLRPMRAEWQMGFASSGPEALEALAKEPFDVIVSDMRMPGMDGADLLSAVMQKYPKMIRFILSGHSDREMILKSVGPTHQFLTKPCSAENLKAALLKATALLELLVNETLLNTVSQMKSLPSLPTLYSQIMKELQQPGASIKQVGEIIAQDVGMTAKILQLVNSAFFGLPRHISSPSQAVGLLGLDTVRALVLSIQVFSEFEKTNIESFLIEALWQHSVNVSQCANHIARAVKVEKKSIDDGLMAGLLHDVGKLVLSVNFPDKYPDALGLARSEGLQLWQAEREIFGASHAEVGAYLMGLWGLPDAIVEALAYHHRPSECPCSSFSSLTTVHVANYFDHADGMREKGIPESQPDMEYLRKIGMADQFPVWREICRAMQIKGEE
jgi:putative nucleotidyltransferase with HDIG domain